MKKLLSCVLVFSVVFSSSIFAFADTGNDASDVSYAESSSNSYLPSTAVPNPNDILMDNSYGTAHPDPNCSFDGTAIVSTTGNDILIDEANGTAQPDPDNPEMNNLQDPLNKISCTDSFVQTFETSDGLNYTTGYTDVENSGAPYNHYTVVSLEKGNTTYVTSDRVYGTGKVSATCGYTPSSNNCTAHVYYGW